MIKCEDRPRACVQVTLRVVCAPGFPGEMALRFPKLQDWIFAQAMKVMKQVREEIDRVDALFRIHPALGAVKIDCFSTSTCPQAIAQIRIEIAIGRDDAGRVMGRQVEFIEGQANESLSRQ